MKKLQEIFHSFFDNEIELVIPVESITHYQVLDYHKPHRTGTGFLLST